MTNIHPSWKQVGDHFEQEYGFQEQLYANIAVPPGQRGLFLGGSYVSFKYTGAEKDVTPLFRQAWVQMRHRYPAIAASATKRGKVYKSPNKKELEEWLEHTFKVSPEKTSAELFRDMRKTTHVTLNYLPECNELFMQSEHLHLDGGGVMCLWDDFFQAVVAPKEVVFGDEVPRLPPRSDDLLDLKEKTPGRGQEVAMSMLAPLDVGEGEAICMPVDVTRAPSRCFTAEYKFDLRTSTAILQACKNRQVTVTAAWHAAMAIATRNVQAGVTGRPGTKFAGFTNFNLRGYFPKSADSYTGTVGNHYTILPFVVEPEAYSFDETARRLTAFYRRGLNGQPDIWAALQPMIETVFPDVTAPLTDTTPAVSSLGNISQFIRTKYGSEWEIRDVWAADTVTGPWIDCFLWAWRDKLVICSSYNTGFYTPGDVEGFNEKIAYELMQGLGLYDQPPISRLI
ncbi:Uu.00g056480.m01.CDS01 [Anthostomella pinea]|uniref:Uu.00g056480.m01.CDS01 n=1 Tax=Anthostomella pinea TaxID=933095 RepID=A0AAI8VSD5_9PEZI|nr:Uu.00g056480.m01.CDS01 [Anthostomella pinea]